MSGVELPERIADRYQVQGVLGRGGMGVIYRVQEMAGGRQLALKQLLVGADERKKRAATEQFEREFYTLSQLAHPRVIEVYDFGIDAAGPYYTMELLEGGDLRELAPLPWKKACALLADVCSALSLIHSRRMVHRDVSPRNIRSTRHGLAKLIDFGAMAPMGPAGHVIGTPSYTAPEVVNMQSLDARSDLYSVGASLYYALTGRHVYPARKFGQLRDQWRSAPRLPSSFSEDIPRDLDDLVMSLVSLDSSTRPGSAAEVMERLCAVAGIELKEQLVVSRAYLSTPTLVGRKEQLLQTRKRLARAGTGRGYALLVEGSSGVGRSRMLDAIVLEGRLLGLTVLRADTRDAHAGDWGAARALALRLIEAVPEQALQEATPFANVLGHLLPELREKLPDIVLKNFEQATLQRHNVQSALRSWFAAVSARQTLVIAVDDLHRIDEPSAAFLVLMAHEADTHRLAVICSAETAAAAISEDAVRIMAEAGASIRLRNLSGEDTEKLLVSVFGDRPNVKLVADRIFTASAGNPGSVMQLLQYLVDRKLVRYEAGAWSLPSRLEAEQLPAGISEALRARAETLGPEALALAGALALCPEHSFSLQECRLLSGSGDMAALVRALDELVAAEVISGDGERYALQQTGWVQVFEGSLDDARKRATSLRLVDVFLGRGPDRLQVSRFLLYAGQRERSADVLIEHALDLVKRFKRSIEGYADYVLSLPPDWIALYESAMDTCLKLGRPRRDYFNLQHDLVRWGQIGTRVGSAHLDELFGRLSQESGLPVFEELGDSVAPAERVGRALEIAQKRFEETAEHERWLPPGVAIEKLANLLISTATLVTVRLDWPLLSSLPSIEPLITLTPALEIVDKVLSAVGHTITARYQKALVLYQQVVDRVEQPDRAGLDDTYYHYTRLSVMYALGQIEAAMGIEASLAWADQIEADPLHQVNAWRIRAVFYLCQGDREHAELCKKRTELLRIQNGPTQFLEGSNLITEMLSYARTDDLMGAKQIIVEVGEMAERFPLWGPMLHYAKGEYQRIRGDHENALCEFEAALEATKPGRHLIWPDAAGACLSVLGALGRHQRARQLGEQWLRDCESEEIRYEAIYLLNPLSVVLAEMGEHQAAIHLSDDALERCHHYGSTGVPLGLCYEARSRIAICRKDEEEFAFYAQLCAEQWIQGRNPALGAKYERLEQAARRAGLELSGEATNEEGGSDTLREQTSAISTTMLRTCHGPEDRASRTLELLVEHSKALGGFLYLLKSDGPDLVAEMGGRTAFTEMDRLARELLAVEMETEDGVTLTNVDSDDLPVSNRRWSGPEGEIYTPLLLAHYDEDTYVVTGLAVLQVNPGQSMNFPGELSSSLSRALRQTGDAVTAFME